MAGRFLSTRPITWTLKVAALKTTTTTAKTKAPDEAEIPVPLLLHRWALHEHNTHFYLPPGQSSAAQWEEQRLWHY